MLLHHPSVRICSYRLRGLVKDSTHIEHAVLRQISRNWADLVKRARSKQLAPDEFMSGTFTISNLGNFGADIFDAILPPGMRRHSIEKTCE